MANREGILNKNKRFLDKRLKDMFGDDFDPIMKSCKNAMRMEEIADEQKKVVERAANESSNEEYAIAMDSEFNKRKDCSSAWEKVAQYTTPKLKAVEVDMPEGLKIVPHEKWLELMSGEIDS